MKKKYLVISLLMLAAACKNADTTSNKGTLPTSIVNNPHTAGGIDAAAAATKPTMEFTDTMHAFGTIHEGEVVEHDFPFVNNGKGPLLITAAVGSCGCTVPDYPHEEIAPGKGGIMKVTFNSTGKSGHQEKSVTIHTNTLRSIHMLYITAEVEKK